jgi:AcrR family transcriptional regulator
VEAGRAILQETGPEGLTVLEVVARARTSVGSFYQRFSGREEFLRHLEGLIAGDAALRFEEALFSQIRPEQPLKSKVEAVVRLMEEERAGASDLLSFGALERARAEAVVRVLLESRNAIRHDAPETAIRIGYAAVSGALRERPAGAKSAILIPELARLWLAYLGWGSGAQADGGSVDFFEVWG